MQSSRFGSPKTACEIHGRDSVRIIDNSETTPTVGERAEEMRNAPSLLVDDGRLRSGLGCDGFRSAEADGAGVEDACFDSIVSVAADGF